MLGGSSTSSPPPSRGAIVDGPGAATVQEPDEARRVSFRCSGKLASAADLAERYAGYIGRHYEAAVTVPGIEASSSLLFKFDLPNAIVTTAFLIIDPAEGILFIDQSYDEVRFLITPTNDILSEQGFALATNKAMYVPGRTVVIGGPLERNYAHWLTNWSIRLILLEELAPEIFHDPDVRFLLDTQAGTEPFASFLEGFQIKPDRIVWADSIVNDYVLEAAIVVSFPSQRFFYPELLRRYAAKLRAAFGVPARLRGYRRIWISRQRLASPRRRVVNMAEVVPFLAEWGFEDIILEDLSAEEQIRVFSDAEIVLGVHGAGFTTMFFCPRGARIVVIEKMFSARIGLDRYFAALAETCGLHYDQVIAEAVEPPINDHSTLTELHLSDVIVDVQALGEVLRNPPSGAPACLPH